MGAAKSSNVANAIANVSNFVSNSTTANSTQVNNIAQSTSINNCRIKLDGDFNVTESANLAVTNAQIISAKQNTGVSNSIQQQMLQQAQSQVGAMGIGYADASNTANSMVNNSTTIQQTMTAAATQYASAGQSFDCNNSTIIAKNLNINFSNNADFLSSQTLSNDQTSNIINDITQTISQKATATVEGIAGILMAIALIAAVFVYGVTKPLSSGGAKVAITGILVFILAMIISGMYLASAPPFFQEPDYCINNNILSCSDDSCVDQTMSSLRLKAPPLKYSTNLMPSATGVNILAMIVTFFAIGRSSQNGGTISGAGDNGGYRLDIARQINQQINALKTITKPDGTVTTLLNLLGLSSNDDLPDILINPCTTAGNGFLIPDQYKVGTGNNSSNPSGLGSCTPSVLQLLDPNSSVCAQSGSLVCGIPTCPQVLSSYNNGAGVPLQPQGSAQPDLSAFIANLNIIEWSNYLSDTSQNQVVLNKRAFYARFILTQIVTPVPLDPNICVSLDEPVQYISGGTSVVDIARNCPPDKIYQFIPDSPPTNVYEAYGNSPGTLVGMIGKCNNAKYKFSKFMQNFGGYGMLALLAMLFLYMFYSYKVNQGSGGGEGIVETIENVATVATTK